MRDLHSEVISAFHLSPDKVTDDLVISRQTATELIRPDVRDLELVDEPEQGEISPLRQPIRTPRDVRDQDTDVPMSQSSWTSSEDTSAEDSCTDEEHDQELFLEAYTAFTTKSEDAGSSVERLPDSWPLARLSITLDGLTSQLSKVVMTATMEIIASCRYPDYGLPSVTQLAKDVTIALALHLADLVANWLCGILDQQAVLLFNESTACMLQASYWVRPIYEELLYSSSHAYQGSTVEAQRASNGLVKVISSKTGSDGDHVPQTSSSCISPLVVLGKSLSASVLQIWFPAGLFEWRPGLVPLEGLPLNIAQNTLRPMFRMCGATSSCLGKALMLSIYSSAFPPYCVELFKGCSANKLVAPGSPAGTSNWLSQY